jgi:predicted lipoprotein with Yx(FWY)xxD motif
MKTIWSVLIAAAVLVGCAAPTVKPMTTPNGKQGFFVSCDGSADDWTTCYAEATKACAGKYTLIDRNESSTPTAYGPLVRRNLIAECKK